MKPLFNAIVSFMVCVFVGCHKDGHDPNEMTEDQRAKSLLEMDVSISEWYMYQIRAADYLEISFDVRFSLVSNQRTPNSIISEQQKNIALIRFRRKEKHEPDLGKWYAFQLDAANALRRQLKAPIIDPMNNLDFETLLKLQEDDWDAIDRERAKLRRR